VLRAIGLRPTTRPLRDVPNYGFRRSNELVNAIPVPLGQPLDDVVEKSEELDGTLIDVKALEAQHVT
jgi:hypothetical protein